MDWNNKTGLTYCRVPSTCHPGEGYGRVWEDYMVCSPTKASETYWTRPSKRIGKIVLRDRGYLSVQGPQSVNGPAQLDVSLKDVLVQSSLADRHELYL
jgi:hypothetical protein